jgi:hypothetical protein
MLPHCVYKLFGNPVSDLYRIRDEMIDAIPRVEDKKIVAHCRAEFILLSDDGEKYKPFYTLSGKIDVLSAIKISNPRFIGKCFAIMTRDFSRILMQFIVENVDKPVELPVPLFLSGMLYEQIILSAPDPDGMEIVDYAQIELRGWIITHKTAKQLKCLAFQSGNDWYGFSENFLVNYNSRLEKMRFLPGVKWAWILQD